MEYLSLLSVADLIMGQSPPSSTYNNMGDGLPFYQGKAEFGDLYPDVSIYCNQPKKIAEPGDILISVRAPVGPTNIARNKACIGRGLAAIRCFEDRFDRMYLLYYLRYIEPEIASDGKGSTFDAIGKKDLENIRVPKVSLTDQKRIAAILGKADRLRRLRRYARKLSDTFLQSVFLEMFGDLAANTKGWVRVDFDEICEVSGTMVDPREEEFAHLLHIGGANIEANTGNLINLRSTREEGLISSKFLVTPDHILFSKIRPKLRKVAYPRISGLCSADIYPIRIMSKNCSLFFLLHYLRSEHFTNIVAERAEARAQIPKVNREELAELRLHLPPMNLQEEFARICVNHQRLLEVQKESSRQVNHLFHSLLHRTFCWERSNSD